MIRTAFIAIALGVLPSACNSAPSSVPAISPSAGVATPAVKKPGDAKVGEKTKCPVSGDEFVITDTSPKTEYEGKTYYFCCPPCVAKFKADPKKYLGSGA